MLDVPKFKFDTKVDYLVTIEDRKAKRRLTEGLCFKSIVQPFVGFFRLSVCLLRRFKRIYEHILFLIWYTCTYGNYIGRTTYVFDFNSKWRENHNNQIK